MRFLLVLVLVLLLALLLSPLHSRGDDPPQGCERKVRVALALVAAKEKKAGAVRPVKLDWLISTEAETKVEEAPAPRAAGPVPCDAAANTKAPAGGCKCGDACPCKAAAPGGGRMLMEPTPYAEVRARVAAGQRVLMMVRPAAGHTGPVRVGYTTLRCDDAELTAGLYECHRTRRRQPDGEVEAVPVMTLLESYERPVPTTIGHQAVYPAECSGTA